MTASAIKTPDSLTGNAQIKPKTEKHPAQDGLLGPVPSQHTSSGLRREKRGLKETWNSCWCKSSILGYLGARGDSHPAAQTGSTVAGLAGLWAYPAGHPHPHKKFHTLTPQPVAQLTAPWVSWGALAAGRTRASVLGRCLQHHLGGQGKHPWVPVAHNTLILPKVLQRQAIFTCVQQRSSGIPNGQIATAARATTV